MSKQSPSDDSCHFDVPPVARANTISMGGQEEHVLRSAPFVCRVMFDAMRKYLMGENGVGSFVIFVIWFTRIVEGGCFEMYAFKMCDFVMSVGELLFSFEPADRLMFQ